MTHETQAAALLPLLLELNDLKRVRVADRAGSLAARLFRQAWAEVVRGDDIEAVALRTAAHAVAAARLAGIDARVLELAGFSPGQRLDVLQRSFDTVSAALPQPARTRMRAALTPEPQDDPTPDELPAFVELLANQPRAGATRPGHRRVVLEPAENHAEHCGIVAVYGVLWAPQFAAEPALPFLAGLAHHLHNALLPDAGFAGDELLGEQLAPLMERFRQIAIEQLPGWRHAQIYAALDLVYRSDTPEAKAFQAADVFDRVLEMGWHAQSAAFTLGVALGEMDIVHPGPVQQFQQVILREAGLM